MRTLESWSRWLTRPECRQEACRIDLPRSLHLEPKLSRGRFRGASNVGVADVLPRQADVFDGRNRVPIWSALLRAIVSANNRAFFLRRIVHLGIG